MLSIWKNIGAKLTLVRASSRYIMRPGLAPKPSGAVGVARPSFSSGLSFDQLGRREMSIGIKSFSPLA